MDKYVSQKGMRKRIVVFGADLDETVERVRSGLGMSRSGFIRYCVLRFLEQTSVLTAKAHEKFDFKPSRRAKVG
jgi:hypothetical protein